MQTYIDCFSSPPFPRAFPRGGGVWDQDPVLMQHFRIIREIEVSWKNAQQHNHSQSGHQDFAEPGEAPDQSHLEELLNGMLEERGELDDQFF